MRIWQIFVGFAVTTVAQAQPAAIAPPPPMVGPPPSTPPSSAPRDPLSLPSDNLPPSMATILGPPPVINPNMQRPPPPLAPPLALAIKAAQAALTQCHSEGFEVGVAISNSIGGMVVGIQAEGAFPGRAYNAVRKNLVSLEFGMPSMKVREKLRAGDFATLARVKPNMTLLGGALPLYSDGKLIGAIGVSGAPKGEIDEVCAAAGAAVFGQALK